MGLVCDYCDRPATWHAASQTPTTFEATVAHTCDEHQRVTLIPISGMNRDKCNPQA